MASSFTWLDYCEQHKRRMLDVIGLFQEKTTRDELGIGTVRDAFADMLFPGTSTVQTRARYFMFVPWIYKNLERLRVPSDRVAERARRDEVRLIDALAESEDAEGVIGIQARTALQRLPSSVYWQGLGLWGIRLFPGPQGKYHRALDSYYASAEKPSRRDDDGGAVDGRLRGNWHPGIPSAPEDFPKAASFVLTAGEASYLYERIMARTPNTLLAFLVDDRHDGDSASFAWEHPQFGEFPQHIREQLEHGRNFSEAIWGAALLYNLMLSEKSDWQEGVDDYRERLAQWAETIDARGGGLASWDRKRFWEIVLGSGARVTHPTRLFIERWLDLALSPNAATKVTSDGDARDLVHDREVALKGQLSRLDSLSALELWNGQAGSAQLTFRWHNAHRILSDIAEGLKEA